MFLLPHEDVMVLWLLPALYWMELMLWLPHEDAVATWLLPVL
jgi:hypothetical protein